MGVKGDKVLVSVFTQIPELEVVPPGIIIEYHSHANDHPNYVYDF